MNSGRMLKIYLAAAFAVFSLTAVADVASRDLASFVNPFIGTSGTGHTTPAACVPFGMIQAGPDTGNGNWDHCSGYVYEDKTLYGFSQNHLSGTGCADLGDIRLLPFTSDEVPDCLPLDKSTEKASPGYYAVTAGGVKTEVTATTRVASYRFTFPKGAKKRLLVDTQWGLHSWGEATNRVIASSVVVTNGVIQGTLDVKQWNPRHVAFVVQPTRVGDLAVKSITELKRRPGEKAPRFVIDFADADASAFVDVALSVNSVKAACDNLKWDRIFIPRAQNPAFFDAIVARARQQWNEILSAATIEGSDEEKQNWYTSLYHLAFQPNVISDLDLSVRARRRPEIYSTFSCWDTFRAAGPLYTILYPDKARDFVHSMLIQGQKTGYLPIWTLWGVENQCMIGTHSIPMIVDAYIKGVWKGDPNAAYSQIKDTLTKTHSNRDKENWDLYDQYGYYPFDFFKGETVSRTLECAYDDWCAAQMALLCGRNDDAQFFRKRSSYWKNLFDQSIGFARSKSSKGAWREPYDPFAYPSIDAWGEGDFTEGNAFQYSWHVMQDPDGLIEALGGREKFITKLDELFTQPPETRDAVRDVSGLIGQYVHGNEPSHHVIYFYSLVGHPEKTAERVRDVFDRFYLPKPDGLCGNDDCGQMSAWYLFSAMGFYPFNPCGGDYVLGAPQVKRVELKVKNGGEEHKFVVIANNLSRENKYVKSITLNGKPHSSPILRHSEIVAGGTLVFEMTNEL